MNQQSDCTILTANLPPVISSPPIIDAVAGNEYRYAVEAEDADNDSLIYQLDHALLGMQVSKTGVITCIPRTVQVGPHQISVSVSDNISFTNFNQTQDSWSLVGDAKYVGANDKQRLRLTTPYLRKTGAAYHQGSVSK